MDYSKLDAVEGLDYNKSLKALSGLKPLYEKVLKLFVNSFSENVDKLNNAVDGEPFTIEIHSFKSSLRNIGLFDLGDIAQEIEIHSKQNDYDYCKQETPKLISSTKAVIEKIQEAF
ncbi:MAG: Hpt domain-containing protein [Oscillospiraceae bacterium]|jgi:HPt (histidine-containing phosphotransfer) domain-containing protein|nr:Hpt domain-containing protein [Oscillospiraceae bacterium]